MIYLFYFTLIWFQFAFILQTEDLKEIALKMCTLPKVNQSRSRLVVITHGKEPAIAVKGKLPFFRVKVHWIDVLISLNICFFLVQIIKQVFSITFFFARRVSRHLLLTVSPAQSCAVWSRFLWGLETGYFANRDAFPVVVSLPRKRETTLGNASLFAS